MKQLSEQLASASDRRFDETPSSGSAATTTVNTPVPENRHQSNLIAGGTAIGAGIKWWVWSVWAAIVIATAGYVHHFGSNVPYWDDWNMVDVITGAQPVTLHWLWSPYGGHRIPLPRLVLLMLSKLSGSDFRAGMYFNVLVLGSAAAALIWASARIRGRASVTDAVFPLLLLHWGHFENLLWSWQVGFGLAVALPCATLAVMAVCGLTPVPKAGVVLAALGIIMMPISDVPGLIYAPALTCWLALTALMAYRNHRRGYAALLGAGILLALVSVIFYFHEYSAPTSVPLSAENFRAALRTSVGFVAGGLGPAGRTLSLPLVLRAVPAAVLLATFGALAWTVTRRDSPAFRSCALLLFLIGSACLVAMFGLGRTGAGAWVGRYFLLAAPIWCAAYLAWPLCLSPKMARVAQLALFITLVAALPLNCRAGLLYARDYHGRMEKFRADLLSGVPPAQLVARHVASLDPCPYWDYPEVGVQVQWSDAVPLNDGFPVMGAVSFHDWIADKLRKLHAAKIGDYARMQLNDPPERDVIPSPTNGFAISQAVGRNVATNSGDSAVLLTPDRPLYIAGVRIRRPVNSAITDVALDEGGRPIDPHPQWVQVFWRSPGESAYTAPDRYVFAWNAGKDEQIVWIFRVVDQIAFHMGNRDIQKRIGPEYLPISLLVPTESDAR